jgi:hypothetical protein
MMTNFRNNNLDKKRKELSESKSNQSTTTSTSIKEPVQRIVNKIIRPKPHFELTKYDPFNEILNLVQTKFPDYEKYLLVYLEESIKPAPEGREYLYNFVINESVLVKHFSDKIKQITDKAQHQANSTKLAALIVRIKRFILKYGTTCYLYDIAPRKSVAIKNKLIQIKDELKKRSVMINFDLTIPTKDEVLNSSSKSITLISTVNLISKLLIELENTIKELLPGLHQMHYLPIMDVFRAHHMINALQSIAPIGFKGVENDSYYISRLLLKPDLIRFNVVQQKQIQGYLEELEVIYRFSFIALDAIFTLDFLVDGPVTINMPVEKFINMSVCSKNTFSRLINALNKFTFDSWRLILIHMIKFNRNEPFLLESKEEVLATLPSNDKKE